MFHLCLHFMVLRIPVVFSVYVMSLISFSSAVGIIMQCMIFESFLKRSQTNYVICLINLIFVTVLHIPWTYVKIMQQIWMISSIVRFSVIPNYNKISYPCKARTMKISVIVNVMVFIHNYKYILKRRCCASNYQLVNWCLCFSCAD